MLCYNFCMSKQELISPAETPQPKEIQFGETIYPFRNGVRLFTDEERSWSIPNDVVGYVSADTFYLAGVGVVKVELPLFNQDEDHESEPEAKVIQIGQEGEVVLADLTSVVPVIWYDDPPSEDRGIECRLVNGDISLRADNLNRNLGQDDQAGFCDWETEDGKQISLQVPFYDSRDRSQRDNRILKSIGIRFERMPDYMYDP